MYNIVIMAMMPNIKRGVLDMDPYTDRKVFEAPRHGCEFAVYRPKKKCGFCPLMPDSRRRYCVTHGVGNTCFPFINKQDAIAYAKAWAGMPE
jgi:hypothetical protein